MDAYDFPNLDQSRTMQEMIEICDGKGKEGAREHAHGRIHAQGEWLYTSGEVVFVKINVELPMSDGEEPTKSEGIKTAKLNVASFNLTILMLIFYLSVATSSTMNCFKVNIYLLLGTSRCYLNTIRSTPTITVSRSWFLFNSRQNCKYTLYLNIEFLETKLNVLGSLPHSSILDKIIRLDKVVLFIFNKWSQE